jgi:hypothetical protein
VSLWRTASMLANVKATFGLTSPGPSGTSVFPVPDS